VNKDFAYSKITGDTCVGVYWFVLNVAYYIRGQEYVAI